MSIFVALAGLLLFRFFVIFPKIVFLKDGKIVGQMKLDADASRDTQEILRRLAQLET